MTQNLHYLFDLDGTIIDTAPDLMDAHNHVMKKFGHETRDLSDIKKLAAKKLFDLGFEILATGRTAETLTEANIACTKINKATSGVSSYC